MCLTTITKTRFNVTEEMTVYKVVKKAPWEEPFWRTPLLHYEIPEGEWHEDFDDYPLFVPGTDIVYKNGFHCFLTRKAAEKYRLNNYPKYEVVKVKVRRIVAMGRGDGSGFGSRCVVVVAKEIFIPSAKNVI